MSEFECAQGHLMSASDRVCKICGGRAVRMDGYSARELDALDQMDTEEVLDETAD